MKIILDLCGGTGAWSKPYKDAGYDVRLITLPENDVITYIPSDNVYGILAAPPCTEFSLARNRYPEIPRDFIKGMNIINACIRIIWQCNPRFWALENPIGLLSRFLGKFKYTFEPWWFGDPWTKRTALWGNFNKPEQKYLSQEDCIKFIKIPIKEYFRKQKICCSLRGDRILPSKSDMDKTHFQYTGMREIRSVFRAITPSGFAKAFFEANR